ncbi:hypothetical protein GBAR_LOCUS30403 [Geodia barretti]|nr:hypothetical protein GBAR_LOCUS30403 [Geodia barretti]
MAVSKGEQVYVLLISHPKLPNDRYFIEKDDGTMGFVMKSICVRMVYLAQQSEPPPVPDVDEYLDQDIYEELPADDDDSLNGIAPPALPPPNPNFLPTRFPAPSQAAPPPPPDEPQDNYEYLPEQEGSY